MTYTVKGTEAIGFCVNHTFHDDRATIIETNFNWEV